MPFELREHTADVAVEATGETLGAVMAAVADGLAAAQCDSIPGLGDRFDLEVRAEGREALLFDLLDRLIYERDVRGVLPAEHRFAVSSENGTWVASGSARGVPFSAIDAREVKAVTYSEMALDRTESGWAAYVVFDV